MEILVNFAIIEIINHYVINQYVNKNTHFGVGPEYYHLHRRI